MTAMAWTYDGAGPSQGKARTRCGESYTSSRWRAGVAAVRKCGGGKNAGRTRRSSMKRSLFLRGAEEFASTAATATATTTTARRVRQTMRRGGYVSEAVVLEQRCGVRARSVVARRRHRAAADAYVRFRDGDDVDNTRGGDDAGVRVCWSAETVPARFTSIRVIVVPDMVLAAPPPPPPPPPLRFLPAPSSLRRSRGERVARRPLRRRVAVDLAADGVVPDSYMVASLVTIIGQSGTADAQGGGGGFPPCRDAEMSLGGAAWSCLWGPCAGPATWNERRRS